MWRAARHIASALLLAIVACGWAAADGRSVSEVVEGIVRRMKAALPMETMLQADAALVERFVTPEDRAVLATRYWSFETDVPVRVSVMRHTGQNVVPFWLETSGFRRTSLRVRNAEYEYEVWQRDFPAGQVGLGINGFDKHRVHYFVSVASLASHGPARLRRLFPPGQRLSVLRPGATIYHDWPDLVLTEVPSSMVGEILLPTIRGRAREAHLIGGFRATPFPSSSKPDLVRLTWPGDPRTTVAVQWRTSSASPVAWLEWRRHGEAIWRRQRSQVTRLEDSRILSDPSVLQHTVELRGLVPDTDWEYRVGTPQGSWTPTHAFRTAPAAGRPFSFVWLSDTHNRLDTAELLQAARRIDPEAAFCAITGDLVGTGQYRDDWDQFFAHVADFACERPIVPAIGNHDALDGLGADLYLRLFALPRNGAPRLQPERSYSFVYGDALFIILDSTDDVEAQAPWLEKVLRRSRERWKFALFHFPPYALSRDYPEIEGAWVPLFDRYDVQFVLCGHVHHLQRNRPMRAGRPLAEGEPGTIYLTTVAVGQRPTIGEIPAYAAVAMEPGPPLYHVFEVADDTVRVRCRDASGKVWDEFTVRRP